MTRDAQALAIAGIFGLVAGCDGTNTNWITTEGTLVGSGQRVTETRPVEGFDAVSVAGAARLVLEQTGVESLQITAESNLMSVIRSEVVNGTLFLEIQPGTSVRTTEEILYRVTAAELHEVSIAGATRGEILGIDTPSLTTNIAGASSVQATGQAGVQVLTIAGASRFAGGDLASREATATVSGASYALLRVSDVLVADAAGASTIEYIGDPVVDATATGGSSVSKAP